MVWAWVVGAMVSLVSGPGWSGLWCLWCLGRGGRGYGVYGVWTWVVGAMVSMVSAGLDLGGRGLGV